MTVFVKNHPPLTCKQFITSNIGNSIPGDYAGIVPSPTVERFVNFREYALSLKFWSIWSANYDDRKVKTSGIDTLSVEWIESKDKDNLFKISPETAMQVVARHQNLIVSRKKLAEAITLGRENRVLHYSRRAGVQPNYHDRERMFYHEYVDAGIRVLSSRIEDLNYQIQKADEFARIIAKISLRQKTMRDMEFIDTVAAVGEVMDAHYKKQGK